MTGTYAPGDSRLGHENWCDPLNHALPEHAWRRGIMAGALILGSVALLALPLSRKSTEAVSGT